MLLATLVETSRRISETTKRLEKTALLAYLLLGLRAEEIEIAVDFLSGEVPQRRVGIGYATLNRWCSRTTSWHG